MAYFGTHYFGLPYYGARYFGVPRPLATDSPRFAYWGARYFGSKFWAPSYFPGEPDFIVVTSEARSYWGPRYFGVRYWGPTYWPGVALAAPVMYADNLLAAIRSRLLATPSLAALSDVYRRVTQRHPVYPLLILNPINERPEFNASNYSFPAWYLFQATVLAEEDTLGETLRDAAYSALMPKHSNPPLLFYGGNEIGRFPGIKTEWEQPGTGPKGQKIWAFAFQFEVYVGRLQ